jgi:Ca-activated chloride channel family protein
MRRSLAVLTVVLLATAPARANGILIPEEKKVAPLAMLSHQVTATVDDQVAVTDVEQVFRNHTNQDLEAMYVFPVPKGASVRKFSVWVNGKETPGELVEADQARKIYTEIVSRTQNPSLLEYLGNNLLRVKIKHVPAGGDQKVKVSFTSVAPQDNGIIEYVYPLKLDGKAVKTLEKFSMTVNLKSQHAIQNIYSPSHNITTVRPNDRQATVSFEKAEALLDRDFQLYYTAGKKDVGLTALAHRPNPDQPGYFMLLAAPRVELSKEQQIPRDMVFVLDTSGSMKGKRMTQARAALKYCLSQLGPKDRFNLIDFSTKVRKYEDRLLDASPEEIAKAVKWVDKLQANGGTALDQALQTALCMQSDDESRPFTVVFFTDGEPTVGETNPDLIVKNMLTKNTASTRIFTFGVGDDLNAQLLDQLAEQTRAVSTFVRENEDIQAKVGSLFAKISNPVLANLKMKVSNNVQLSEVYPNTLPDLFHGTQLVIFGRYDGDGPATITLTGNVGKETKEFTYELKFPAKTNDDRAFVEDLWARRKVGFLLDQIRVNGDKKELVDEVILLAKRYGITTPYTSYLITSDVPVQNGAGGGKGAPAALMQPTPGAPQAKVQDFVQNIKGGDGKLAEQRRQLEEQNLKTQAGAGGGPAGDKAAQAAKDAQERLYNLELAKKNLDKKDLGGVRTGNCGVDYAVHTNQLRNQSQTCTAVVRKAYGRTCLEVGGVWIDDCFDPKMKTVTVMAQSEAYFRMLEKQPKLREVFTLGNHVVWVTPSGTALIIDSTCGDTTMEDAAIERLFVSVKK